MFVIAKFSLIAAVLGCAGQVSKSQEAHFDFSNVPLETEGIFVFRMEEIFGLEQIAELESEEGSPVAQLKHKLEMFLFDLCCVEDIRRVQDIYYVTRKDRSDVESPPFEMVILDARNADGKPFDMLLDLTEHTHEFNGQQYVEIRGTRRKLKYAWVSSDRLLLSDCRHAIEAGIKLDGGQNESFKNWFSDLDKKRSFEVIFSGRGEALDQFQRTFPPYSLFSDCESVQLGLSLKKKVIELQIASEFSSNEIAEGFVDRVNSLSASVQEALARSSADPSRMGAVKICTDFLGSIEAKLRGKKCLITGKGEFSLSEFQPDMNQFLGQLNVATSLSNQRQVGSAMRAFKAANGVLPTSVMVSKFGKKYSWRIAVLPYVGEQALFDEYRFDEEWNSPHNLRITKRMPDIFRYPTDEPDSTSTSAFVIGNTEVKETGVSDLHQYSDAIIAIESKSEVHWSNPKDLIVAELFSLWTDDDFESSVTITLADGSVHRINPKSDLDELLIGLMGEGHMPFNLEKLRR